MYLDRLDDARRALLIGATRVPALARIVHARERRVAARALAAIGFALVLAVFAPAFALAVSPALLGVPHAASAFRYLVLRQGLGKHALGAIATACITMAALRMAEQWMGAPAACARAEVVFAALWTVGAAIAGARASRAWGRLVVALASIAPAAAFAMMHPVAARLAFVHVHNLGAVLLWVVLFRRHARFPAVVSALLLASLVLLLSGVTVPITRALGADTAAGVDLAAVGAWLVPGVSVGLALPLVLAHAFTDSVHYAFWLGVIPDETLRGEGTLSFRMTLRGLVRDFGKPALVVLGAAWALVVCASVFDASGARGAYFAVAGFHGYVEGTMLVFLMMRGQLGVYLAQIAPCASPSSGDGVAT